MDDIAGDTLDGLYRSIGLVERILSEGDAMELTNRAKLNPRVDDRAAAPTPAPAS